MSSVFFSYAREDKQFVDQIYLKFREVGLKPWMDRPPHPYSLDGIKPGEKWESRIQAEMKQTDFILAFLSESSVSKRGYVQKEFRSALKLMEEVPEGDIFLIPVLLDQCKVPPLQVGTRALHELQFYELYEHGVDNLIEWIQSYSSREPSTEVIVDSETLIKKGSLSASPRIIWSSYVGKQKWKNRPLILGNYLFVGSAGKFWNKPDSKDGIYAIDTITGEISWFVSTMSDVNEIVATGRKILAGTDSGHLWSILSSTGTVDWRQSFENPIYAGPILIDESGSMALIVTSIGNVYIISTRNGQIISELHLDGSFRANLAIDMSKMWVLVPSEQGSLFIVSIKNQKLNLQREVVLRYKGFNSNMEDVQLYCPPVRYGNIWIQGYVRSTYFESPALMAIDLESRMNPVLWYATDPKKITDCYGNIRSIPLIVDGFAIFGNPYSNLIVGINLKTGKTSWVTEIGEPMFPQWASPSLSNTGIILPRHDGYLYKIDRFSKKKEWGVFLGKHQFAGLLKQIMENDFEGKPVTRFSASGSWDPLFGSPIFATASCSNRHIFVGTDEGYMYCLED